MIYKCISHTVLTFRTSYFLSPLKVKFNSWQELKLFHNASLSFSNKKQFETKNIKNRKSLKVWEHMTASELAKAMNVDFSYLKDSYPQYKLSPNTRIKSLHLFTDLAHKLGWKFEIVRPVNEEKRKDKLVFEQPPSKPENLVKRPPVVTIMGHVDHGKTTLLDAIRNSFIVEQEFGGITQHIGAFSVEVKPGQRITFIDTPGHAAFTSMRARGAEVTDIVVLVIAADDGVMQQTIESISIAKAAQVRVIIAVNKIDKPKALPIEDIKNKLLVEGIQAEDQGGDVQVVPVSALKRINLDLLTEVILLEAELMDLKGDPTGLVEGVVIESKMGKSGALATIIIKRGTLRKEKILVAGLAHGRVRRMLDENGKDYEEALPSTPVQILGWKELPVAGDKVFEVSSEKQATVFIREMKNYFAKKKQEVEAEIIKNKLLEEKQKHYENKAKIESVSSMKEKRRLFFQQKQLMLTNEVEDTDPHLNIILKGDVYGTLEVLEDILESYNKHEECKLTIVESSIGDIKPKDLEMAEMFNAIIYAFNVNLPQTMTDFVKGKNVEIRCYNVIYKLIDNLKEELDRRIPPQDKEKINGEAEVIENFIVTYNSKKLPVAGSKCIQGQLNKESLYKILRKEEVIYEGKLIEMRHEKNVVKTITKGMNCGLLFESFPDKFKSGDKIICYDMIKVQRKSSWDPGF